MTMFNKTMKTKPNLPFTARLLLSAYTFATRTCIRSDGTINRRLFSLLDPKVSAPSTTTTINNIPVSATDIHVDPSRNLLFRLYVPTITTNNESSARKLPLVIYFHGGGFSLNGSDSRIFHDVCCHLAAETPAIVASVNYRLAPENRFPCPYDDGFDTLKFIDAQNNSVLPSNTDLTKCFIAGDSAGGNIAHHITQRACKKSHELFDKIKIIGLLAIQPFFGGEERTESELRLTKAPMYSVQHADEMWKNFLPQGADRNHKAAQVFCGLDCIGHPNTLLIVGGFDPLQDWQKRYYQGLKRCGKEVHLIEYPNAIHGFYVYTQFPEFGLFIKDARNFIHGQLSSPEISKL